MRNTQNQMLIMKVLAIFFTLIMFSGCEQNSTVNEPNVQKSSVLEKDGGLRIPDTYVQGDVTLNSSPYSNMKVRLRKGTTVLDSTYSDSTGFYSICVCCQQAGTGTYAVYTDIITIKGEEYQGTASFYWSTSTGPFFEITKNLPIVKIETK